MIPEPDFQISEDDKKVSVVLNDVTASWYKSGKMKLILISHGAPYDDAIKCIEKLKQITSQR